MRDIITKLEELNVEIVTEGYEKQVLNVCKAEGIDCSFRDGNLHLDKEDMSAARDAIKDADMEVPKMIAEGLGELAHEAEKDHEVQMARSDLYKIAKYAVAIHKMLKDRSEMDGLEGWVQSKITKSADYMGAVKHYMEGEAMQDVELAVVPVAGDMTDAMTMPEESVEVIEAEERDYICVHAKKGKYECSATSSYGAAKKAAEHWGLKSTAGIDAHLADEKKTATESVEVTEDRAVMVRATNIDYAGPALDKLPTDVNVKVMVNPGDSEDEIFDAVADELEDRYGVKVNGFDMKMMEDMSDEEIDDFHKELDDVVHKHLGHSSDEEEMNEEDPIGDIIAKLGKMKTPGVMPKPKPNTSTNQNTGATRGAGDDAEYMRQAAMANMPAQQKQRMANKMVTQSKFSEWGKK